MHQHSRHHSIIPLLPEFDAADINKYTAASGSSASTESAPHLQTDEYMQAQTPLRQLPQKRLFGNMFALVMDEQGNFTRLHRHWDGSPWIGFRHAATTCHRAYLATTARQEDVKQLKKRSQGSDTDESNDDDHPPKADAEVDNLSAVPSYKQGMTGQEVKALGRKIPWRKILEILHRKVPDADPERSWQLVDMAGC